MIRFISCSSVCRDTARRRRSTRKAQTGSISRFPVCLMPIQFLKIWADLVRCILSRRQMRRESKIIPIQGAGATGYSLNKTIEELQADGSIVLEGTDVEAADGGSGSDSLGNSQFVVDLVFTSEGTTKFADATTKAFANNQSIGIYYDGDFISVPNVQAALTDGKAQITGMGTFEQAERLASQIRIGGLKLNWRSCARMS